MAYSDEKFGELFPTRHGVAIGAAAERKMLDSIGGAESFRTIIRNNLDGSTTRCRTRNGMPHFETTGREKAEKKECVWSFSYHPIKTVNGTFVPDTIPFGIHTVPQMSISSGSKVRRKGVVTTTTNGTFSAVIECEESAYEGVDENKTKRIHGSHYWYKGGLIVTWTKRTYTPVEDPTTGLPRWRPVGVVRFRTTEIEVFEIGGGEEEANMTVLAACIVNSPNQTPYIRVAVARQQSALNPLTSVDVKDYTLSGRFVSEKRIEEGAYFHNVVEGFSPAAWAPNGIDLIVGIPHDDALGVNAVARIYAVSRPDSGVPSHSSSLFTTDVSFPPAPIPSTTVVESSGAPLITETGNLHNLAPYQFEVLFYEADYDKYTGVTTVYTDLTYLPYSYKSRTTTVTTRVEVDGRSDMWPESVGFTSLGLPCVVVGTERVESNAHTTDTTDVVYSLTYGNQRVEEQVRSFDTYINTSRRTICDSLDEILDGAYTTINKNTAIKVDRAIYITVGGAVVWSDTREAQFNITENSSFKHEYYIDKKYDKEPIPLLTTRQGERVDDATVKSTPVVHMALNNIVSDFIDGYVAVYDHPNIQENPTTRTQTNTSDVGTQQIRYRLTGVVDTTSYANGPITTDVVDGGGGIPELISPTISVIDTGIGGIVGQHTFSWTNTGVSGYRSYFDGTAAWCPINESLLAVSRRPVPAYTGWMFSASLGWMPVSLSTLEPAVAYNTAAATLFDFTKLSPFA